MTVIRTGIPQYMANLEAQRDVAIARAEAAEKKVAELEQALKQAYPFMACECDDEYQCHGCGISEAIEKVLSALNKSK